MAGGGGGGDGEPEFQIAPMVDVLLVMLIFFMTITSTQVLKVDKSITLPPAPHALKKDDQRSEAIVNVRWHPETRKAEFVMDDKEFSKANDLVPLIQNAKTQAEKIGSKSKNPTFRVVVRADRDVPARYVSQAMNACATAGISDLSFSAVNKE